MDNKIIFYFFVVANLAKTKIEIIIANNIKNKEIEAPKACKYK